MDGEVEEEVGWVVEVEIGYIWNSEGAWGRGRESDGGHLTYGVVLVLWDGMGEALDYKNMVQVLGLYFTTLYI